MPKLDIIKILFGHKPLSSMRLCAYLRMALEEKIKIMKPLLDAGGIKLFKDLFQYVPKSSVAKKLGIKYHRFLKLTQNPQDLRYREVYSLARVLNIDPMILSNLVHNQINQGKRGVKKVNLK